MAVVRLEVPPSHGTVTFEEGEGYTNYSSRNQRYTCNLQKSPVTQVFYTSVAGYKGPDQFVARAVFPNGDSLTDTVNVSVE